MLSSEEYVLKSIASHLFWIRIMKEHAAFLESSLPAPQKQFAARAEQFRRQFDRLLLDAVRMADGVLTKEILESGQFYTAFTETAEETFSKFTGIELDRSLTAAEYSIAPSVSGAAGPGRLEQKVTALNRRILGETVAFSRFQSDLIGRRSSCELFLSLYPAEQTHLLLESTRYEEILNGLLSGRDAARENYLAFWNRNMADHAKAMRGLFDPTEVNYFRAANSYAAIYDQLAAEAADRAEALDYTRKIGAFKTDVTQNLIECRLKGILSALYTDHLLREANHYIFLLQLQ